MNKRIGLFFLVVVFQVAQAFSIEYYSQYGQDSFVNENFFHNKRKGVFLDIGAGNGVKGNNTYFFEKHLDWRGIAIEPIPNTFDQLKTKRRCQCILGCIGSQKGSKVPFLELKPPFDDLSGITSKFDQRDLKEIKDLAEQNRYLKQEILVNVYSVNEILEKYKIHSIDFFSLDTNGGELEILRSINWNKYKFNIISVRNKYSDLEIREFFNQKAFVKVAELGEHQIYIKRM